MFGGGSKNRRLFEPPLNGGSLRGRRGGRGAAAGGTAAGDVDVVLLDQAGVLRRKGAADRLLDQLTLPGRQVQERAVAGHVHQLRGGVVDLAVGLPLAAALG